MRYRGLSSSGDYQFGSGQGNFIFDADAVAQAVKTRMQLLKGTFWRDLSDGLPLFQNILAARADEGHLQTIDNIVKQRILGTKEVTGMTFYERTFDRDSRDYGFTANINTQYTEITVSEVLS